MQLSVLNNAAECAKHNKILTGSGQCARHNEIMTGFRQELYTAKLYTRGGVHGMFCLLSGAYCMAQAMVTLNSEDLF